MVERASKRLERKSRNSNVLVKRLFWKMKENVFDRKLPKKYLQNKILPWKEI